MSAILNFLDHFTIEEVVELITKRQEVFAVYNDLAPDARLTSIRTIEDAIEGSLIWVRDNNTGAVEIIKTSKATFVICGIDLVINKSIGQGKLIIQTANPRLFFMNILSVLASRIPSKVGVHPSAIIHSDAKIGNNVYIGPYTVIGNCTIGDNTIIESNVTIFDHCLIGDNVVINAGTVIGADGFGYEKLEDGSFMKFIHIGNVIIESDVEVGANTCIDRATLGSTIIRKGAKIDNLVHIAHNVIVGENSAVIALAMIGGSTKIGSGCWISPAASVRDGLVIGKDSTVGMGSVVTKSIPDGEIWTGNPARLLSEFVEIQKKIKTL